MKQPTYQVSARLSAGLYNRLTAFTREEEMSMNQAINQAIEKWLDLMEEAKVGYEAPQSAEEASQQRIAEVVRGW